MMARVVVTGSGVISSIGAGVEEFERNLYAGCSGVGPSPLLGEKAVAAEVRNFNPQTWLGNKGIRVLDRKTDFGFRISDFGCRRAPRSGRPQ